MHSTLSLARKVCLPFLTIALCAAIFPSCTEQKSPAPTLPVPGMNHLPQIYLMLSESSPVSSWTAPNPAEIEGELSAHVETALIKNESEAIEKLRVWNARPIDLLILGPGLPQETFLKLKLPRVEDRLVLALASSVRRAEWTSLPIDETGLKKFIEKFCSQDFARGGCRLIPATAFPSLSVVKPSSKTILSLGQSRMSTEEGLPVTLNIVVHWPALLRHLYESKNSKYRPDHVDISFKSGFFEIEKGPGTELNNAVIEKFLRNWKLDSLAGI